MAISKRTNDQINYSNRKKTNQDFMYKDLRRSNCFNCDFSNSNFDHTSLRGAQFKSCNFTEATFESAEFVAANLKNSKFKQAQFVNTLFDSVNLEGVDFEGAVFEKVIFVGTDMSRAIHLDLSNPEIKVFEEMPEIQVSKRLESAFNSIMKNDYIKFARVLDTKEGAINPISMMTLLEKFDEETLIKGLGLVKRNTDKDFCTLSYILKELQRYEAEGLI